MANSNILELYNYDEFVPEKFERWLNFASSPPLGKRTEDFTLLHLDGISIRLSEVFNNSLFTMVEFGSFT